MRSIARWSVEHRVTVNLLMVLIMIVGVMSLKQMRREMLTHLFLELI